MRASGRTDSGVTLIELLVSVAILGIVGTVLASTMFVAFRTSSDAVTTLNESNDRDALAYTFPRDVQDAPSVLTTATVCIPPASTLVVRFRWTETPVGAASVVREVVYSQPSTPNGTVVRSACIGAAPRVDTVLTRYTAAVALTCLTSTYAIDPSCGASTRVVRLTLTPSSGSPVYTVEGSRRPT
jgi:prepilin-type N-terminal cleavage/methylation domain-containing protein